MDKHTAEFMKGATNVYRTKNYIVRQEIGIRYSGEQYNAVYSYDTFFRRTKERDKEYETLFCMRKYPDGKRLPTTMYARKYVE